MYMSSVACVDADTDVGTAGVVVGVLLVVGTILTPLPQFAKILRHNSAEGVSLPTLSFIVAQYIAAWLGVLFYLAAAVGSSSWAYRSWALLCFPLGLREEVVDALHHRSVGY